MAPFQLECPRVFGSPGLSRPASGTSPVGSSLDRAMVYLSARGHWRGQEI